MKDDDKDKEPPPDVLETGALSVDVFEPPDSPERLKHWRWFHPLFGKLWWLTNDLHHHGLQFGDGAPEVAAVAQVLQAVCAAVMAGDSKALDAPLKWARAYLRDNGRDTAGKASRPVPRAAFEDLCCALTIEMEAARGKPTDREKLASLSMSADMIAPLLATSFPGIGRLAKIPGRPPAASLQQATPFRLKHHESIARRMAGRLSMLAERAVTQARDLKMEDVEYVAIGLLKVELRASGVREPARASHFMCQPPYIKARDELFREWMSQARLMVSVRGT